LVTFVSFIAVGFVPLMPFVIYWLGNINSDPFVISSVMTALAFFVVGAIKSRFVQQRWWLAGSETLAVGAIAAGLAYLCGHLLASIAA
jgi:VIT1/CCC1 family predicted Fe2+/Mn2+ transporter